MEPKRYRVGVLGATGLVGRQIVSRVAGHPWFELVAVAASQRSAGRRFGEVVPRGLAAVAPDVGTLVVRSCEPDAFDDCDVVFSALDASTAAPLERALADDGLVVVSNSSAHRQGRDIPILVPEINAAHVELVAVQQLRGGAGYIVTNPNCSAAGLIVALAPLHRELGIRRLVVTTLQAISGAGADGPRAVEMIDNVIPWIPGEEQKLESETRKMLGRVCDGTIAPAEVDVSAHCHRVGTLDGHLEAISMECEDSASPEEAARILAEFVGDVAELELPTSPPRLIDVRTEDDRPQPRLDRDAGNGMTVVVGRIRPCNALSLRMELLSHNLVRGAAGGAVLNAELLAARGLLHRRSSA
jgi:aspartate-semialdehyde dehydrogenase